LSSSKTTVLLVDDARDDRAMYAEFLRLHGFAVVELDQTPDAQRLSGDADVIVTDVRVPGAFDGIELVRRLRADERTRDVPIIVLTACAFEIDRRRSLAAGCDLFLSKPCLPDELLTEIRLILERDQRQPHSATQS
jgi:two-component system, cell cycle response regulator DivK